jgi:hypothetical protein
MNLLIDKIDEYLLMQEKKDAIDLSLNDNKDLKDVIEIIRKSSDKDKIISIFTNDIREQIKKLIDGGIIKES